MDNQGAVSPKILKIVHLIHDSPLDWVIQQKLVELLLSEGLTPDVKKTIEDYCYEGLAKLDKEEADLKAVLGIRDEEKSGE